MGSILRLDWGLHRIIRYGTAFCQGGQKDGDGIGRNTRESTSETDGGSDSQVMVRLVLLQSDGQADGQSRNDEDEHCDVSKVRSGFDGLKHTADPEADPLLPPRLPRRLDRPLRLNEAIDELPNSSCVCHDRSLTLA